MLGTKDIRMNKVDVVSALRVYLRENGQEFLELNVRIMIKSAMICWPMVGSNTLPLSTALLH